MSLTGKRRYRLEKRFLRPPLLVLQVEYRDRAYDPWGGYAFTAWRDAAVEELMVIPAAIKSYFSLETADA